MPIENINGVSIFLQEFGSGGPLVLVHGSWVDHMEWPFVVPLLAPRFRVTVYDRRGHSQSERLPTQGSTPEDAADLAAIIERTFCATIRRRDRSLRTSPPPLYPSRTLSPRGRWRRALVDSTK